MMTLKVIAPSKDQIKEIADFLMQEKLIAEAFISGPVERLTKNSKTNGFSYEEAYTLSGLSKSLLFAVINQEMRKKYGAKMPLLYAEPLIMMDPEHTEKTLAELRKV
ncbi:hypothetical protein [Croceiramulus getboli]|nr:hypothetical protein P8624_13230 [Flavobacteriaceae bacterium YJPT1-3]